MTTTSPRPRATPPGLFRNSHRGQFARFPVAVSLLELGVLFILSALVDLFDDADVTLAFLIAGMVLGALGVSELRRVPRPSVTSAGAVFTMVTLSWLVLIAGGALAHLLADATDALDTAIFEGAATSTTTAMTAIDPAAQPMGLLLFRAMTQWLGGLGGLLVALIAIPLVFGGREMTGRVSNAHARTALLSGRTRGVSKLLVMYVAFTGLMVVAYALAGMTTFDAVAHAMATASTGGLSTETLSLGAYSSAAIEWVAVAGMAVAGVKLTIVWWAVRGDWKPIIRSSELKLYLAVMVLATGAAWLWLRDSSESALRTGAMQVTSAMSTTGFVSTDWPSLDLGLQTLLVVLVGVGAMAGSAGGGFRYLRVLETWGMAKRELTRQLHPSAIGVVRINGDSVSELALSRESGYLVLFMFTGGVGSVLIAVGDSSLDPAAVISLTVSALATAGPHLGDTPLGELGAISKLSMATLMLLGRLSIYAVIVAIANAIRRLAQAADPFIRRQRAR